MPHEKETRAFNRVRDARRFKEAQCKVLLGEIWNQAQNIVVLWKSMFRYAAYE
jgi:hypothetical protein